MKNGRTLLRFGGAWLVCSLVFVSGSDGQEVETPDPGREWPQLRGVNRDGIASAEGLFHPFPEDGPRVVWRRPLGEGFSGIAVSRGRLFTLFAPGEDELAAAFDASTGQELWRAVIGLRFPEEFGDGPRSTPTVDDDTLYALGARGQLHALRIEDGSTRWRVDLPQTFGSPQPGRGFATSPLLDGDLLLAQVGGGEGKAYAAVDKSTGEVRWTTRDGRPGYSSPIAVTIHGIRQYVFAGPEEIVSLLPDGEVHWRHEWPPGTIAMPIFVPPDEIFVSASYDVGATLLRVIPDGESARVEEVWRNRVMKNHFSSSVVQGRYVYGFDNATLKCISLDSGEQRWAKRGFGKGSLIVADGHLIVLSDRGTLVLAEATPEGFTEKAGLQVFEGKTWTSPSLAQGRLYLRDQNEMVAVGFDG